MSPPTDSTNGFIRQQTPVGDWNMQHFRMMQLLAKVQTALPVRVLSCTNDGGVSPVGFVDIVPLVDQVDAAGNALPHATIYNVPYSRLQGGANAVIIDPEPGDIGIAVFASRDISKVKSTKQQSPPGSARQYSFSDAMYIGGLLNGIPTQYLQFSASGINIVSPTQIAATVQGSSVLIDDAQVLATAGGGTLLLDATGLWHNGVQIGATHVHTGVTPGLANTGPPDT